MCHWWNDSNVLQTFIKSMWSAVCSKPLLPKNWRLEHLRLCVHSHPGWLVGERPPASALPSLVSLRLLPEASGWLPAPPSGYLGGEALCHRGAGWPGYQLLYPWLCTLSDARQHKVTHHSPGIWNTTITSLEETCFSLYPNSARFSSQWLVSTSVFL